MNKKLFLNPPVGSKKMKIHVRVIIESQKRNTIVLPQQDDKQGKLQSDLTLNESLYSSTFIRLTLINFHPFLMTLSMDWAQTRTAKIKAHLHSTYLSCRNTCDSNGPPGRRAL